MVSHNINTFTKLITLLLHFFQTLSYVSFCLCKREIFNLHFRCSVIDDELWLHQAHCHLQEGQAARDLTIRDFVYVNKLLLTWLESRVACPRDFGFEDETGEGGEAT